MVLAYQSGLNRMVSQREPNVTGIYAAMAGGGGLRAGLVLLRSTMRPFRRLVQGRAPLAGKLTLTGMYIH